MEDQSKFSASFFNQFHEMIDFINSFAFARRRGNWRKEKGPEEARKEMAESSKIEF